MPVEAVSAVGAVSVTGHLVADRIAAMVIAHESGDVDLARELITSDGEVSFDLTKAREAELVLALNEAEAYSRSTKHAHEALRRIPDR